MINLPNLVLEQMFIILLVKLKLNLNNIFKDFYGYLYVTTETIEKIHYDHKINF